MGVRIVVEVIGLAGDTLKVVFIEKPISVRVLAVKNTMKTRLHLCVSSCIIKHLLNITMK